MAIGFVNTTAPHTHDIEDIEGDIEAKSCSGNSKTASQLETARKINGVDFDGSSDIQIPPGTGFSVTLSVEGWSGSTTQRVSNVNFEPEAQGWSYLVTPYPAQSDIEAIGKAKFVGIMDGGIEQGAAIFTCGKTPTGVIRMNILKFKTGAGS